VFRALPGPGYNRVGPLALKAKPDNVVVVIASPNRLSRTNDGRLAGRTYGLRTLDLFFVSGFRSFDVASAITRP
jgi:hypothetical protein